MSTIEEALVTELTNDSEIAEKIEYEKDGCVFYRIFPDVIDTEEITPIFDYGIRYVIIGNPSVTDIDLDYYSIQIDAVGSTHVKAQELRDDIIRVLQRFKGLLGGLRKVEYVWKEIEVALKEPNDKYYIRSMTFRFKFIGDNI